MKNKKRFIILVILYIAGYLYFCIYGGINYGLKVSDSLLLRNIVLFSDMPVGAVDLSINMFVWCIASFFLVLFILWQTNLSGVKLNRMWLICYAVHMMITCLSRGIVEWIVGGEGLSTTVIILIVLMVIVGISLVITYFVQKANGMLGNYQAYSDIMTEEEFEKLQQKKMRKNK